MAAPKKIATRHYPELRQRIKASQLINRLQGFALHEFTAVDWLTPPMSTSQVQSALGLLKKCLPDLAHGALTIDASERLIAVLDRLNNGTRPGIVEPPTLEGIGVEFREGSSASDPGPLASPGS